ncbi:galactose ABC transporter substrate-binding protein [Clostridium saccharoperbutylacetonicum]
MLSKKIAIFFLVIVIIAKLSINYDNNVYANNDKIVNVDVLLYTFDDPFMSSLKQSLENIQKENPTKIHFTFHDGKNNIVLQNVELDSIVNRGSVDLVMANLADISENAINGAIDIVKPKEIPIVFLDVPRDVVSKVSKNYKKAAFILANSDLAGTVQGNILVNLWNSNKKAIDKNNDNILQYVLLQGEIDNPVAIDRTNYVISTINNSGISTQQLALINANWFKELARDSIESLFLRYNDKIEAIISNNDAMAIGAIEALQKYGYNTGDESKNIAVVGIDAIPEARDLIYKGFMTSTVIQDSKVLAEVFYNVGMNLVRNLNPIENTNYKIINGEIIVPFPYEEYVKK